MLFVMTHSHAEAKVSLVHPLLFLKNQVNPVDPDPLAFKHKSASQLVLFMSCVLKKVLNIKSGGDTVQNRHLRRAVKRWWYGPIRQLQVSMEQFHVLYDGKVDVESQGLFSAWTTLGEAVGLIIPLELRRIRHMCSSSTCPFHNSPAPEIRQCKGCHLVRYCSRVCQRR